MNEKKRKPAYKTFIRMVVYPCLGVGFVVAMYFNPRVQTEYNLLFGSLEGTWEANSSTYRVKLVFYSHGESAIYVYSGRQERWHEAVRLQWRRDGSKLYSQRKGESEQMTEIQSWTREGILFSWDKSSVRMRKISHKSIPPSPIIEDPW